MGCWELRDQLLYVLGENMENIERKKLIDELEGGGKKGREIRITEIRKEFDPEIGKIVYKVSTTIGKPKQYDLPESEVPLKVDEASRIKGRPDRIEIRSDHGKFVGTIFRGKERKDHTSLPKEELMGIKGFPSIREEN